MLSFFFPPPPPPPPVALTLTLTLPVWITADVLLTVVFILMEVTAIPTKIRMIANKGAGDEAIDRWRHVLGDLQAYLVVKTFTSAAKTPPTPYTQSGEECGGHQPVFHEVCIHCLLVPCACLGLSHAFCSQCG